MIFQEKIHRASIRDLRQGYTHNREKRLYGCLFCDFETFRGRIYQLDGQFQDAELTMQNHIHKEHGSPFEFLISLDKENHGLSANQRQILQLIYQGKPDAEIARMTGKAQSTIRNVRYVLKEKFKETKIFVAIIEELYEKLDRNVEKMMSFPNSVSLPKAHLEISEREQKQILAKYFRDSRIEQFPKKEKRKLVLLHRVSKLFEKDKKYSEKEVNEKLKKVAADHVTIRRYLIDYGFLERQKDGSEYWLAS